MSKSNVLVVSDVGLFGPFTQIDQKDDRYTCYPGGIENPGVDLPFVVLGARHFKQLCEDLPEDFSPETYTYDWVSGSLVPNVPVDPPPASLIGDTGHGQPPPPPPPSGG